MTKFFKFATLAPALLLGGCISFGGDAPDSLLTLTPTATAPAGSGASSNSGTAVALMEFEAPSALDVTRVPVQVSDTELAYLEDAVWVEKPARLFRRLIAETIRTRSNRVVIDGDGDNVYGGAGTGLGGFSALTAAPGDTVTFTLLVQNEGGGNVFDLEWNTPAGWSILLDGQTSPVTGVSEGTYT